MGMKKQNSAMLMMMAAAMSGSSIYNDGLFGEDEPFIKREPKPVKKVTPKGMKEYFFNIDGMYSTKQMLKTECVFKCFAINDKNAKKKFNKWNKT